MDRNTYLELLESRHTFPGPYTFRVIGRAEGEYASLRRELERCTAGVGLSCLSVGQRESSKGTYMAWHVEVSLEKAEQVLELTEIFQKLTWVKTVF